MKRILLLILMGSILITSLVGCGGEDTNTNNSGSNSTYDNVSLKLTANGTEIANDTKAALLFKKIIEEKSGGSVKINVFPNDQLASGNMQKGLELVADGTVDLDVHSTSIISNLDNRLMVSTLPWTFADYAAAEEAFYGKGGEFLTKVLDEKGLVYLGAVHNGFKAMTSSDHPIKAPADLKGMKIRIPGGDFFSAFYKAFGASPQAMSWSEVFTALQQGTIDGHDNSLSTINSANVQEVQPYITISNHTYEAFTFTANKAKFSKLNEATQQLIFECIEEATKQMNQEIVANEATLKEKFVKENGVEIYEFTADDTAAFKEVVKPLIDEYKGIYGEEACAAFNIK